MKPSEYFTLAVEAAKVEAEKQGKVLDLPAGILSAGDGVLRGAFIKKYDVSVPALRLINIYGKVKPK
jgi:hypothetical protein